MIAKAAAEAKSYHIELMTHVLAGHAVPRIVETIEQERFDLLVVGYMGQTALYNRLIGGTSGRLVEMATCSVLVVK